MHVGHILYEQFWRAPLTLFGISLKIYSKKTLKAPAPHQTRGGPHIWVSPTVFFGSCYGFKFQVGPASFCCVKDQCLITDSRSMRLNAEPSTVILRGVPYKKLPYVPTNTMPILVLSCITLSTQECSVLLNNNYN